MGGPRRHRLCQNEVVSDLNQRGPSVEQISRIGVDTSKHFFQLHGVNAAEKVVLRKKLRRKEMVAFFKALAPTVIGIEACGASHHWARILRSFGHEVKTHLALIGRAKLMGWHKADKTPAPELFRSGRQFAAWIGLTPKDHSTAGKVRLGVITRAGDEAAVPARTHRVAGTRLV